MKRKWKKKKKSNRRTRQQSLLPKPPRYLSNRSNAAFITTLILRVIINTHASPVFNNTLILYNGKTLPLFVNRTVE